MHNWHRRNYPCVVTLKTTADYRMFVTPHALDPHVHCNRSTKICAYFLDAKEYCNSEIFEASCNRNEVIIITHARFGRMRVGGCIPKARAISLNCYSYVTAAVQRECTGRNQCRFRVPHKDFHSPCPKDLASYLEASYKCVPGTVELIN